MTQGSVTIPTASLSNLPLICSFSSFNILVVRAKVTHFVHSGTQHQLVSADDLSWHLVLLLFLFLFISTSLPVILWQPLTTKLWRKANIRTYWYIGYDRYKYSGTGNDLYLTHNIYLRPKDFHSQMYEQERVNWIPRECVAHLPHVICTNFRQLQYHI